MKPALMTSQTRVYYSNEDVLIPSGMSRHWYIFKCWRKIVGYISKKRN